MTMKKYLTLFPLGVFLYACQPALQETFPQQESVRISLTVNGSTKASAMAEDAISRAEIYVFEQDGTLETHASASGGSVTVTLRPGTRKEVYAIVNQTTDCRTLAQVQALTSSLNATGFVMSGRLSGETFSGEGPFLLPVSRQAVKISLGSITNDIREDDLKGQTFVLRSIYLVNVAPGPLSLWNGPAEPDLWINQGGWVSSALDAMTQEVVGTTLAPGETLPGDHIFYCFPHTSTRKTKLVIEALIGTQTCYYPIELNQLAKNTRYRIPSLSLQRFGSSSPDESVTTALGNFQLLAQSWQEVPLDAQEL